MPQRRADVGFAERLLEVIDSGRRTATYKLALLLALLDLCARHSDAAGRAPALLHTRDIAEQVAALYWPQVIPYRLPGTGTAVELRQITLPRAAIVQAVSTFRGAAAATGTTSWQLARQRLPSPYNSMLNQVEVTVATQPLPRLQAVGSAETVFPFLYELSWGPRESFSVARLRRHGHRGPAVHLLPGAGGQPCTSSSGGPSPPVTACWRSPPASTYRLVNVPVNPAGRFGTPETEPGPAGVGRSLERDGVETIWRSREDPMKIMAFRALISPDISGRCRNGQCRTSLWSSPTA